MAKRASDLIIGLDFGGTKIEAGLMSIKGKLVGKTVTRSTLADRPAREIVSDIAECIKEAGRDVPASRIRGVGVGSPGPLDLSIGKILQTNNLPTMTNYPLKREIEKRLKTPIFVNNDANCFALGESYFGAGKGYRYVYGITLGTGFGNAFVMNGKLYIGATGTATEVAITPYLNSVQEDYISGRGISMIYNNISDKKADSLEINKKARAGERAALECWQIFGMHLGRILAGVVNLLDPDMIVIGGSISSAYSLFAPALRHHLMSNIWGVPKKHLKVKKASLGPASAVIGAGCLVIQENS